MTTEQVPPIADEMPAVEPEGTQVAGTQADEAQTAARVDGVRTPEVDVEAMRGLLDGRYREVRDLVRANLVEHADILVDAEEMGRAEFRDRVRDVVVMMAETGQTGMGFPEEYRSEEHTSELQSH